MGYVKNEVRWNEKKNVFFLSSFLFFGIFIKHNGFGSNYSFSASSFMPPIIYFLHPSLIGKDKSVPQDIYKKDSNFW